MRQRTHSNVSGLPRMICVLREQAPLSLSEAYVNEFFSIWSPSWIVGILRDSATRSAGTGSDPNVSIVPGIERVPAAPTKQRADDQAPPPTWLVLWDSRVETNAMRLPSGDQAGCASSTSVSLNRTA